MDHEEEPQEGPRLIRVVGAPALLQLFAHAPDLPRVLDTVLGPQEDSANTIESEEAN